MSTTPQYASLRDYLAIVRQNRLLVIACVLVGAGLAAALSVLPDKTYRAESAVAFRPPTQDAELVGINSPRQETPAERAAVGAERANRREVVEAVREKLKLPTPITELEDDIDARPEVRTNLVVITVEDTVAERAARIANAMAEEVERSERRAQQELYDDLIRATRREYRKGLLAGNDFLARYQEAQIQDRLIRLRTIRDFTRPAEVTQEASTPTEAVSPKVIRNMVLGPVIGLILGVILAFLRVALDRRLRSQRDIEEEAQIPILSAVRERALGHVNLGDPATGRGDAELDLEAFRILHTNLDYLNAERPPRRVLVTSAVAAEGKSTTAAGLAVAAGLAGRDVLLIESDLRSPVLATWLGVEPSPGIVDYVLGRAGVPEVVRAFALTPPGANGAEADATESPRVISVITAGTAPPRPAELLQSPRFADVAAVLGRSHDLVLFDAPPLLPVPDALELVGHVDAVLLCVRANKTTRDQLRAAMEALGRLPHRPTGIVMTGVTRESEADYGYARYEYAASSRG